MRPVERTLNYLREHGWLVRVVERYVAQVRRRFDTWGADVQGIKGRILIGFQVTSGDHHPEHVTKALANPEVWAWLRTGNGFEVWSWKQKGDRGKRKLWERRVTQLYMTPDGDLKTSEVTSLAEFED